MARLVTAYFAPLAHQVLIPHGRWLPDPDHPRSRRMLHHIGNEARDESGPFRVWLEDPTRLGDCRITAFPSGIQFEFTNADTALEFKMRFG